jgi:hypothetical protein
VEIADGQICQLQQFFEDDEYHPGSWAQLRLLEQRIADEHIEKEEASALLGQHNEDRRKYLEKRETVIKFVKLYGFHQASYLPGDALLVVRTKALREFESQFIGQAEKPESTRKTENLLRALTCIAIDDYGYDPLSGKNTAPKDIADALSKQGQSIDPRTIRDWLKEGARLLPSSEKKD